VRHRFALHRFWVLDVDPDVFDRFYFIVWLISGVFGAEWTAEMEAVWTGKPDQADQSGVLG